MKYDCNKTKDFIHEARRMCASMPNCEICTMYSKVETCGLSGINDELVKKIQEWSDTHPEPPKLTKREHDFLSMIVDDGLTIKRTRMGLGIYSKTDEGLMFLDWRYFNAVDRGRIWTVEELLKLEVEE